MTREELTSAVKELGMKPFVARQIWNWLHTKGALSFAAMRNVSKQNQEVLARHLSIYTGGVDSDLCSTDGTRKWLLRFDERTAVEAVYIPEVARGRGSMCLSSQCGCSLACSFCHTGTQKISRNLTAAEIVGQILTARRALGDAGRVTSREAPRAVSNIVMMGQGEPLYNYRNVRKALQIAMDGDGIGISRRRITLSTSGVVPMIERLGQDLSVGLAISLHAVDNDLRDELVPANKQWPIEELLDACRRYPKRSGTRRITFEYILIEGVNDSLREARELLRLLRGIPSYVNLIPFNPWPGAPEHYSRPSGSRVGAFQRVLIDGGMDAIVRATRGEDILAACGQLHSTAEASAELRALG
jgi:23S rRNA (adenine2503-C2)-methyltransferase